MTRPPRRSIALILGFGRAIRSDHRARYAESLSDPGNSLGHVACRCGNHSEFKSLPGQMRYRIGGAANLERAYGLKVFPALDKISAGASGKFSRTSGVRIADPQLRDEHPELRRVIAFTAVPIEILATDIPEGSELVYTARNRIGEASLVHFFRRPSISQVVTLQPSV